MATRKKKPASAPASRAKARGAEQAGSAAVSSAHSTIAGPAMDDAPAASTDVLLGRQRSVQELAAAFPSNPTKLAEYGDAAREPTAGEAHEPDSLLATASTVTEATASAKSGPAPTRTMERWIAFAWIPVASG
jgi:hypothetical protein